MRCILDRNTVQTQNCAGRSMRIYREPNLKIINSSLIDHGSLLYSDRNQVFHNHTSTCNAGYRVSEVSVIMTSSTVVFNSTRLAGNCESIYAYKCNLNFTGNNSLWGFITNSQKHPQHYTSFRALFLLMRIVPSCTMLQ